MNRSEWIDTLACCAVLIVVTAIACGMV